LQAQGPDYINAVAELRSDLPPQALLRHLLALEAVHGRQRPFHHAPRTLDLDLLRTHQQQVATPELTLPHPRLHQRAFVLLPLLELAPDLVHPSMGALQSHLAAVADQLIQRVP
jgi:2-amino-4-hydroxy-6-hydroxymethyldihydropteridine diphosphokinase